MNKSFPIFTVGAIAIVVLYYAFLNNEEPSKEITLEEEPSKEITLEQEIQSSIGTSPTIGLIDDQRIMAADNEPGNWLSHGRTYEEQRFSPLDKINKDSISKLGLAWYKDM